ncbi:TPA: IS1-like element transposase [Vibrio diabolicus]
MYRVSKGLSTRLSLRSPQPDVKERIVDMSMNSYGVRETAQVLNVAYNTVLSILKNLAKVSNLNTFR